MAWPTNTNIASRLGRTLTSDEIDQADLLLEQAVAEVALAAGKDDDWAAALTPIPAALAGIVVEAVARAMTAAPGVRGETETLGAYTHSTSYTDGAAGGLALTSNEERKVRRIIFGGGIASAAVPSILDDLYEYGS